MLSQTTTIKEAIPQLDSCPVCHSTDTNPFLRAPDRFHARSEVYQLVRCSSCALVWIGHPPNPEDMERHYGPAYDRLVSAAGESIERWVKRRQTLMQYKWGGSLLDLGCSSGAFLESIKDGPWNLHGIEMSEACARKAIDRSGARVFVGDVLNAPFSANSFDVVTCFHVFEHMYDPRATLEKVSSWLKPGGIFYTIVPNIDSAGARIFGSYWYALELPRHLYHFSPESIRHLARAAQLQEVSIETKREPFVEQSVRYVAEDLLKTIRLPMRSLADAEEPGFSWRVVRKLLRVGLIKPLSSLCFLAGDGESIHIILQKGGSV